eukprot:TRINITY_DN238_c0_g1_i1.p1 TRINITY_DN238_c0_g1~~TRINITY_DN238_c0_g1_i1.p1  ORF type:complete len:532 (-),score=111.13 TRINITY_DN238_c0_g1_i1:152-1705(-)
MEATNRQVEKRKQVAQELINTERHYVKDLVVAKEVFLVPIKEKNLLTKSELVTIFSNLESIILLHQELLASLELTIENITIDGSGLGEIFLKRMDRFKLYAGYCSNQPFLIPRMAQIRAQNKAFATFLDQSFKNPRCKLLPLESFLILPLQRVCKYPLLLKELLQTLDPVSPERRPLSEALERVKQAVDQVNEKTREVENLQKMIEVNDLLETSKGCNLLLPTRKYIREGPLVYKKKTFYAFLFNDLFVLSKQTQRKTYLLLTSIPLAQGTLKDSSSDELSFGLLLPNGDLYNFQALTTEAKIEWRDDLKNLVNYEEVSPEDHHHDNSNNQNSNNSTSNQLPKKPPRPNLHLIKSSLLTTSTPSSPALLQESINPQSTVTPGLATSRRPTLFRTLSFRSNNKVDKKNNNGTNNGDEVEESHHAKNEAMSARVPSRKVRTREEILADQVVSNQEKLNEMCDLVANLEKERDMLAGEINSIKRAKDEKSKSHSPNSLPHNADSKRPRRNFFSRVKESIS